MNTRKEHLFTTLFLGIGGILFLLAGAITGFAGAALSEGMIPMTLGAAFLLVMGIYRMNTGAERIETTER